MRRRTFDALVSWAGVLLVVVLVIAGALLTWGHAFAGDQVASQLAAQKIVFPAASSAGFRALPPADQAAMAPYAGQLMTTGEQAAAYANHFIAVHLRAIGHGQTYSQLSAQAQAQPGNTALAGEADTVFKGTTLRSMLLEAYAFGTFAAIAWIAAIVCYAAAFVLLLLAALGFAHERRTSPDAEMLPRFARRARPGAHTTAA